jgi:acetoin utilization deacetylase AcuC-like enzyme
MKKRIVAYYTPKQVLEENIALSTSKSPLKPKLVMSDLMRVANQHVHIQPKFKAFTEEDFRIAHTPEYVNEVFNFNQPGVKLASAIPWSEELVTTLTYTSSSLYHAIKHSIEHPEDMCFAPVSGFHHSQPRSGLGFCTFAGQVVSSVKLYRESGKRGCYLDLDGHFGNSIEDCRSYVPDLNKAVPDGFNFNPQGEGDGYCKELQSFLHDTLSKAIFDKEIDYVVWCHGADSHIYDDFGGQVDTEHWTLASEIFWDWVKFMDDALAKEGRDGVPVSFALFGGYRVDDYQSVINLHISDIVCGINTLIPGAEVDYKLEYTVPKRYRRYGK